MLHLAAVQPLAVIIGALITATAVALVTYFIAVKRKSVTFWVGKSEDLTFPFRGDHKKIFFKIGDREFHNLNKSTIFVKNTGNTSIQDLKFDIEIPGDHPQYIAEAAITDGYLRKAIKITYDEPALKNNPRLHVTVSPFLNSKEAFEIFIYFDNTTKNCNIYCRMEDVKSKVRYREHKSLRDVIIEGPYIFGILGALFVILANVISLGVVFFSK